MSDVLKTSGIKTSFGWLEVASYDSDPTDTDSLRRGFCYVGTTFKTWNGTTWAAVGGGGSTTSWDEIYDLDKTLTIDEGSLTYAIAPSASHLTADGFVVTGSAALTGDCIHITNSGSGKDIAGTSDTWSITKAGIFDGTDITTDSITVGDGTAAGTIDSSGNYNLILQTGNATTSAIEIVDGTDGDVDITLDGAGAVNINGTTTHNDALVVAAGDVAITLGSLTLADDGTDNSVTITNDTHTTGSATTGGIVELQSTSLTTGVLLNLELTETAVAGGYYLRAYDVTAGSAVATIGEDGILTIAGPVAGNNAIVCTTGDLYLSDSDTSVIESENGTDTLLTVDNKLGAIGSDDAVLTVDAGGTVNAAGFVAKILFTGTDTNHPSVLKIGSLGTGNMIEFVNTNAGATGNILEFNHDSASPADNDIITRFSFYCDDSGGASAENARIDVKALDVTAATEDAEINFEVMIAGTLTEVLSLVGDTIIVGSGAAAYISSAGAYDLVLETNEGTDSGTITIADAANGDITFAPNGTGSVVMSSPTIRESSMGVTANIGSGQGDGAFTEDILEIATCGTTGDAVTLPAPSAGKVIIVINRGANSADIFPASGDDINEAGANTQVALAADASRMFVGIDATHWESFLYARA